MSNKQNFMSEVKDVLDTNDANNNTSEISKEAETRIEQKLKKEMKNKKRPGGGVRIV